MSVRHNEISRYSSRHGPVNISVTCRVTQKQDELSSYQLFKEYPVTCSCNFISKSLGVLIKRCLVTGTILFNLIMLYYLLILILWILCKGTSLIQLHVFVNAIAVLQRQLLLRCCIAWYRNFRRSEHLETLLSLWNWYWRSLLFACRICLCNSTQWPVI